MRKGWRCTSLGFGTIIKKGMTVLDPFVGSGTTIIAANRLERDATLRNVARTEEIDMKQGSKITKMAKIIETDQTSTTEEKVARIIQNKKEVSYQTIIKIGGLILG